MITIFQRSAHNIDEKVKSSGVSQWTCFVTECELQCLTVSASPLVSVTLQHSPADHDTPDTSHVQYQVQLGVIQLVHVVR